MTHATVARALLSVFDKTGLVEFARGLSELGVSLYSSGGTHAALTQAGLAVTSVADLTGFPEILDGRVKTLHPAVHAGLLARRDRPEHLQELARHGLHTIDLLAGNLYPFVETVARAGVTLEEALENIDIGGPAMIRAAAKNFPGVIVVVDPADYEPVVARLRAGDVPLDERRRLAGKAFQHVALYDTAVARYLSTSLKAGLSTSLKAGLRAAEDAFPASLTVGLRKRIDLRYGENPHQRGAFYTVDGARPEGMAAFEQLNGKELSYVNVLDADAAYRAACDFDEPAGVVVKHATACGLATAADAVAAWKGAFAGDPVSAFGGIVGFNRPVDETLAKAVRASRHPTTDARLLLDVMIAPDYTLEALALLRKSQNLRLLRCPPIDMRRPDIEYRHVVGGMLIQDADRPADDELVLRVVSKRAPSAEEEADIRFAWRCVKHVKSNAIVIAKGKRMLGTGAGQTSRVQAVELALKAAGDGAKGAVLASDALFPFAKDDAVEMAYRAGVAAIVEPGGAVRDQEAIEVADQYGGALVFTGYRHFRH